MRWAFLLIFANEFAQIFLRIAEADEGALLFKSGHFRAGLLFSYSSGSTGERRRTINSLRRHCFNLSFVDACLVYLAYPPPWQRTLYSTNPVERYIEEIRRRTIPMRSFNNAASANRLIYGIIAYVLIHQQPDRP